MMRVMVRTRRKMMMLRRKTDPKTGKDSLCEPAQSKCTWTWYKSHFVWKFTGKMPDPNSGHGILCEPAQSKCTWTFHKSHFVWKFKGEMPDPNSGHGILCEPARSKRTWTCHKSHFVCKFVGKMPDAPETTSIKHRGLNCYRKNPFSVATLFGEQWLSN